MKAKVKYTDAELLAFRIADLENDARCSEEQAKNGPFFPNVTREVCLAYAEECRMAAAKLKGTP
jgi:hypothetical protein